MNLTNFILRANTSFDIYLVENLFICEPLILHYFHLLSLLNNVLIHRQHVSSEYKVRGGNGNVLITLETGVERDMRNYNKITHHTSHPRPKIHTLPLPTNLHNIYLTQFSIFMGENGFDCCCWYHKLEMEQSQTGKNLRKLW